MSLGIRGLIPVIFVLQLVAVAGQAHSQDLNDTDDWAGVAPPGFNLVFDGPVTVDWNDPNQILRTSLRATNLGSLAWEFTGFRWGVFDAENPLHDVIGRGSYVNIEAEAHLGYEVFPLDAIEIDIFWRTRAARNHAPFVEQADRHGRPIPEMFCSGQDFDFGRPEHQFGDLAGPDRQRLRFLIAVL